MAVVPRRLDLSLSGTADLLSPPYSCFLLYPEFQYLGQYNRLLSNRSAFSTILPWHKPSPGASTDPSTNHISFTALCFNKFEIRCAVSERVNYSSIRTEISVAIDPLGSFLTSLSGDCSFKVALREHPIRNYHDVMVILLRSHCCDRYSCCV